jgi:hypothetical protein
MYLPLLYLPLLCVEDLASRRHDPDELREDVNIVVSLLPYIATWKPISR